MSPAYSHHPDDLHTWVGIIMYLPTEEPNMRDAITRRFWEYNAMCRRELWPEYNAHQHWAKIEMPEDEEERLSVQVR
jgi:L-galactono-1,4-lactone dehydrogenase